jgi:CBS domain containing-hemolysin-like protein
MPEGDSSNGSRQRSDDNGESRIWQRLKTLVFRRNYEPTLREQLEEKIIEHEEEIAEDGALSENAGDLSASERVMVRNLLSFSESRVDDVMVTRSDILGIEHKASFTETVAAFVEHGHSRMPIYEDTLDKITGMVHVKDIFNALAAGKTLPKTLRSFIRQPLFVPQSMGAIELLDEMRRTRTHLAIVIDEYSGTEGLVTIEDLVEEIVGEIEDEYDDEAEALFKEVSPGIWEADARAELDDMAEAIDPRLCEVEEDIDTIGGLSAVLAGHVPTKGDIILHEESGWRIEILEGDERRVGRVRLHGPEGVEAKV